MKFKTLATHVCVCVCMCTNSHNPVLFGHPHRHQRDPPLLRWLRASPWHAAGAQCGAGASPSAWRGVHLACQACDDDDSGAVMFKAAVHLGVQYRHHKQTTWDHAHLQTNHTRMPCTTLHGFLLLNAATSSTLGHETSIAIAIATTNLASRPERPKLVLGQFACII